MNQLGMLFFIGSLLIFVFGIFKSDLTRLFYSRTSADSISQFSDSFSINDKKIFDEKRIENEKIPIKVIILDKEKEERESVCEDNVESDENTPFLLFFVNNTLLNSLAEGFEEFVLDDNQNYYQFKENPPIDRDVAIYKCIIDKNKEISTQEQTFSYLNYVEYLKSRTCKFGYRKYLNLSQNNPNFNHYKVDLIKEIKKLLSNHHTIENVITTDFEKFRHNLIKFFYLGKRFLKNEDFKIYEKELFINLVRHEIGSCLLSNNIFPDIIKQSPYDIVSGCYKKGLKNAHQKMYQNCEYIKNYFIRYKNDNTLNKKDLKYLVENLKNICQNFSFNIEDLIDEIKDLIDKSNLDLPEIQLNHIKTELIKAIDYLRKNFDTIAIFCENFIGLIQKNKEDFTNSELDQFFSNGSYKYSTTELLDRLGVTSTDLIGFSYWLTNVVHKFIFPKQFFVENHKNCRVNEIYRFKLAIIRYFLFNKNEKTVYSLFKTSKMFLDYMENNYPEKKLSVKNKIFYEKIITNEEIWGCLKDFLETNSLPEICTKNWIKNRCSFLGNNETPVILPGCLNDDLFQSYKKYLKNVILNTAHHNILEDTDIKNIQEYSEEFCNYANTHD